MPGEHNLDVLLRTMTPTLWEDKFVFCSVLPDMRERVRVHPVCEFEEAEGITLILPKREAEAEGLSFEFVCRMITLSVHSNLTAVGFLSVITQRLAAHEIPVNVVSAFYHDHLFVPEARADDAMKILSEMTRR
jgi:hypothetical protein